MKRMIMISVIACVALTSNALAQQASDALLLSQYYAGGTARSVGMSGAFGALGGDLSVLSTNPAGLAVFRGSEFTFSPGLNFTSTNAKFANVTYNDKHTQFIINNIGYVYTKNLYNEKGFQSVNFGIAYNRLSDFNTNAYIRWPQARSSMLDGFVVNANDDYGWGVGPVSPDQLDPFYERVAYDTYGIDINKDDGYYWNPYIAAGDQYGQPLRRTMYKRGGIGEYDLSFGANLNHTLFFGASLGIQDVTYEEYYTHEEEPGFASMDYFTFYDDYSLNGWGLNFKLGIIYRPIQMLRIGAAVQTPTRYWLKPYHYTRMDTWFNTAPVEGETNTYFIADAETDAPRTKLTTPWRYSVSAATVLGSFAVIDVDVEYVDYSTANILPKSDFETDNDNISYYKGAVNVKGGAEFRLGPMYLRGGVAYYGSAYKKADLMIGDEGYKGTMSYSGGLGFRARNFYMDAAYSYMKFPKYMSYLYTSYDNQGVYDEYAQLQTNSNKVILTFGFKF